MWEPERETFESVLQTLFPITSEQIQKNAVYNPDTQSYRYRPRGDSMIVSFLMNRIRK